MVPAGTGTSTVTIAPGTGTVTSLAFDQGDSGNVYRIQGTVAPVTIVNTSGGGGGDAIGIGTGPGGNMDGIGATVTVNYNSVTLPNLTINDAGSTSADSATVSATQVSGMATGAINFPANVGSLAINAGSGGNTFAVTDTPSATVVMNLGTGNDTANVQDTGGLLPSTCRMAPTTSRWAQPATTSPGSAATSP